MEGLPAVDDDLAFEQDAILRKKEAEKAARIASGADPAIDVDEETTGPGGKPVSELTYEEREARWGFTHEELKSATKVADILFHKPQLYVGDPYLAESRLYTMISRDRKAKRENKDTFKQIMNEERSRKEKKKQEEDVKTMRKTQMKQERDAALARLLEAPSDDDEDVPQVVQTQEEDAEGVTELKIHRAKKCHTCKKPYTELHKFYYSLCIPCGDFNFLKRNQTRDLKGKTVLLTGCRIKIGYEMCLSLLRCGATVIGTTRFAYDAVSRFQQEEDYPAWQDRLHLFSLDLRDLWMVTQFCGFICEKFPKLFAIINNAAQTIARTPEYTERLRAQEVNPTPDQEAKVNANDTTKDWRNFFMKNSSVTVGQPLALEYHPDGGNVFLPGSGHHASAAGAPSATAQESGTETEASKAANRALASQAPLKYDRYDTVFELSDKRDINSWTMNMGQVTGSEATETMAINALAPFIINARLKPLLLKRSEEEEKVKEGRFVINVSAMEGQFYRYKQTTHPHTNMAKAALNMMTRTSGADYAKDGIYMNSVDTGWITDESPQVKKARRSNEFQQCPLDEVDAAARCLDLIYIDSKEHSQFWKDYHTIPW